MKKIRFRLECISSVILSPREQECYNVDAHFQKEDIKDFSDTVEVDKIKMIYPFYQYGSYTRYMPEQTQYYIPGSSVKGAIGCADPEVKLMVEDIPVDGKKIQLKTLHKIQYLFDSQKHAKVDEFFPMVAAEMLRSGSVFEGELFCEGDFQVVMKQAQERTEQKLRQFFEFLEQMASQENNIVVKAYIHKWEDVIYQLKTLSGQESVLLLGGYKGLLLSGIQQSKEVRSSVYIDTECDLPHGLVKIIWEAS